MNNTKYIIAFLMKYAFVAILLVILFGVLVNVLEHFKDIELGFTSKDVYYVAAIFVCITPFLWGIIYIINNLRFSNIKAVLLGLLLLLALSLSFVVKIL